ncbi:MAG: class I SAM-dependent methyltransferase [Chloroflexi bacterium]|nr:class I SAM-dependent methyltransferase [Chloroflexota bacterium]
MYSPPIDKAATRGVPSLVWRSGQERRLTMILEAAGERLAGDILVDGSGIGTYVAHLAPHAGRVFGLDIEVERVRESQDRLAQEGLIAHFLAGAGERLPFPEASFDLVLSHEVLEHVQDDRQAVREIIRTLRPGGRLVLFCPNRGYPFETHGIYWRGKYRFGNIPLVNYLPRRWRDRLAPHVRAYSRRDLEQLFAGLPVQFARRTVIFGAYDNIIARHAGLGKLLRGSLQALERSPLRELGLSHFWVVEKTRPLTSP